MSNSERNWQTQEVVNWGFIDEEMVADQIRSGFSDEQIASALEESFYDLAPDVVNESNIYSSFLLSSMKAVRWVLGS